jgi:galactokinase
MELAKLLRRSENEFVGVASGLLDQFSSLFGRAGHVLYLDCRTLEHHRLPLGDPPPALVVCDSKTSRRLADGMYNTRRAECERVVAFFQQRRGPDAVKDLRDVSLDDLQAAWDELDPVGRLRARHVLNENERVRRGAEALRSGDAAALGTLMSASHASSRDDFANSSPALDALIEAAEAAPGFLGGKLSGAGWAGCTVNLVRTTRPTPSPGRSPSATSGGPAHPRGPRLPRRRRALARPLEDAPRPRAPEPSPMPSLRKGPARRLESVSDSEIGSCGP